MGDGTRGATACGYAHPGKRWLTRPKGTCKFSSVKSITTEALRHDLTTVRKSVEQGNRWLVTFHDKPRFAIVPLADLERIQQAEAKRPKRPRK